MNPLPNSLKILAAWAMLLPTGALAGQQFGFVLPGIAGTESLAGIDNVIPIESFAFGLNDFFVTRYTDSISPLLYDAAISNQHFGSASVYVFDSVGAAPAEVGLEYTMSNVVADAYSGGHPGSRPIEDLVFSYSKIVVGHPGGGTVSAPELDVTSTASGISLLMGSLLVLRARRRPRNSKPAPLALA